jgi:hypothetical protein
MSRIPSVADVEELLQGYLCEPLLFLAPAIHRNGSPDRHRWPRQRRRPACTSFDLFGVWEDLGYPRDRYWGAAMQIVRISVL